MPMFVRILFVFEKIFILFDSILAICWERAVYLAFRSYCLHLNFLLIIYKLNSLVFNVVRYRGLKGQPEMYYRHHDF